MADQPARPAEPNATKLPQGVGQMEAKLTQLAPRTAALLAVWCSVAGKLVKIRPFT